MRVLKNHSIYIPTLQTMVSSYTAIWLAFQSTRLVTLEGTKTSTFLIHFVMVLLDFFSANFIYEFVEDKNSATFYLWFISNAAVTLLYKSVLHKHLDFMIGTKSNEKEQTDRIAFFVRVSYIFLCFMHIIFVFLAVLVPYPNPPGELIISISFSVLSFILVFINILNNNVSTT